MGVLDTLLIMMALISALTDLYKRRIYNLVLFPAIIFALTYRGVTSGWTGVGEGIIGLAAGIGILLIPYAAGGVGPGDVKLLGAFGACGGAGFALYTFLAGAVIGGVASGFFLSREGKLLVALKGACYSILLPGGGRVWMGDSGIKLPYGVMLCAGALTVLLLR
ncbi:MAG: prepilin peptidase [Bacillota bacterium]